MNLLVLFLLYQVGASVGSESYLHNPDHVHNKEHLKEHIKEVLDTGDAESLKLDDNDALEFHYFKLHDYDNNDRLDGLELAAALTHFHEEDEGNSKEQAVQLEDSELASIVEQILKDDDLNGDGYIDYYEFIQAQQRNRAPTNAPSSP